METLFTHYQHKAEPLKQLSEQIKARSRLLNCLKTSLSSAAQAALLDATVKDNTLHILTTSAAWSARLRLSTRQLLSACQANVTQLQVHIAPAQHEAPIQTSSIQRIKPNEETLNALASFTNQRDQNDALTQALKHLVQTLNREEL
jgi:hypothetical protein